MNEAQIALRIRQALNAAADVDPATAARLRVARERALERQRSEAVGGLALAGSAAVRLGGWRRLSLRVLLPLAILGVAFAATQAWQKKQRAVEIEELDAQLLSSDLPIDAYLDQGFAAWLKRRDSR